MQALSSIKRWERAFWVSLTGMCLVRRLIREARSFDEIWVQTETHLATPALISQQLAAVSGRFYWSRFSIP